MEAPQLRNGVSGQVATPGLDTLGLLAELQAKFAEATREQEAIKQRHIQELVEVALRRKKYSDDIIATLQGIEEVYPKKSKEFDTDLIEQPSVNPASDADTTPSEQSKEPNNETALKDSEDDESNTTPNELLDFSKRGVLKSVIIRIITESDTFLTSDEINSIFSASHPKSEITRTQIIDLLKDSRKLSLVGQRAYNGRSLVYLNGLPQFYSDVEHKDIKPEYQDKYLEKLISLNLSDSMESISPLDKEGGLFTKKEQIETAPVEAGAELG